MSRKKTDENEQIRSLKQIEEPYKNRELNYKIKVKYKNQKQKLLATLINEKDIVFCTGECGTGKSYIALATALELLQEDNRYKKIMIIVPTAQAGVMDLGYLKGTREEKIQPFLEADLYSMEKILNDGGNDGEKVLKELTKNGLIEGDCVNFLRGKTIDDKIVIISECENFSKQELFLILSRIGSSKYIFNGDVKQLDRKDLKKSGEESGVEYAIKVLNDLEDIGMCHFDKSEIVRNPIISKIMDRWFVE